jgi:hypothetical protein
MNEVQNEIHFLYSDPITSCLCHNYITLQIEYKLPLPLIKGQYLRSLCRMFVRQMSEPGVHQNTRNSQTDQ